MRGALRRKTCNQMPKTRKIGKPIRCRKAIRVKNRSDNSSALKKLREFICEAEARGGLDEWRRGQAILGYIDGRRVVDLAKEAGRSRGSVNRWLQWYESIGVDGLLTGKAPGPEPKLTQAQQDVLVNEWAH